MRAHSRNVTLALVLIAVIAAGGPGRSAKGQDPAPQPPAGQKPPATPPPGDQTPVRAQQPPIRTGINFVRVDAIVTDGKGEPVLDLKPEEFTLTEDNKPQKIEQFTVVKIDALEQNASRPTTAIRSDFDEEREAARPDVRLFVLLLDDYHVRRGNDMAVRKPLQDFIANQLDPADMVAIMYPLTPVADIHFSRNRGAMIEAIANFEGRKFNYQPRNPFEEQYAYYPAQTVERVRNQVTMGALKAAAVRLGGLREGRKSIIFVSEGFTTTLPPQLNDPIAAMPGVGNPVSRRPTQQTPATQTASDRADFINQTDLLNDMRDVFDTANKQNTSIYPVDPRGLAAVEYGINEGVNQTTDRTHLNASLDTLRTLAGNTDGRAIINRNDLATGMKQIIRDSSGYYLLGYNSTQAPQDGKFHEIKVRVTRRGLDVRARKGYWALTAEEAARATAPPKPEPPAKVSAALNAIAEPERGRPARFWIGTARGDNGMTRVTFSWEPITAAPGTASDPNAQAARIALTASSPDGKQLYKGRVPEEAAAAATGGAVQFDGPPGPLQMRIVVEGQRGQVVDSVSRDLTLPDFTKVQVSLATPRVFRGRTVRDLTTIKGNPNAVPTADRDFSRTDRLLIRTEAYAPGGAVPALTARLLNRGGGKMADLTVQAGQAGTSDIELPLSALAAGDYLIEVNAKTDTGTAQELIAFKVGR
ncbi:MAG TPA: VWA domain-containing protein [Vicinamibacterales bacterium]|nr:VWA domain-containing protein [Vicinamibacterales bacterium]